MKRRAIILVASVAAIAAIASPFGAIHSITAWQQAQSGGGGDPFTPASLTTNLVMWLRSSETNNMDIISDQIQTWTNSAPDYPSSVFTAINSFRRPNLIYNDLNGYTVVEIEKGQESGTWSGTNDLKKCPGASSFVVMKPTDPLGKGAIIHYSDGSSETSSRWRPWIATDSQQFTVYFKRLDSESTQLVESSFPQTSINTNDWLFYSSTMSYTNQRVRIYANGQSLTNATVPEIEGNYASDTASLKVEVFKYFFNSSIVGAKYADIVTVKRELTQTEVEKLEGWAAHRYNLTDLLPVNHPYKDNAPTE